MATKTTVVQEQGKFVLSIGDRKFTLIEISVEEIEIKRRKKIPSFLLKQDGKYYWTEFPRGISLFAEDILGQHKCSNPYTLCKGIDLQLSGRGCKKILAQPPRLEDFEFITLGWETFATEHDCLSVIECSCYKVFPPRKP